VILIPRYQHQVWEKHGTTKKNTEAVMLRLPVELIAALDKSRREADDLPSRPEIVRRLIQKWIEDGCPKV